MIASAHPFDAKKIQFSDFVVSCAAESPFGGFCFGSEDGKVRFTGFQGPDGQGPYPVVDSGEAINGIAFLGQTLAVSTRSEVALWDIPEPGGGIPRRCEFDGGAHGVIATSSGRFVAPLGWNGLLVVRPARQQYQPFRISRSPQRDLEFYQCVSLQGSDGYDVLASAARQDGIATVVLGDDRNNGSSGLYLTTFPGRDVIDICALGTPQSPHALAAIGSDLSLYLVQDAIQRRCLPPLKFEGLEGTPYRLLTTDEDLILLTSQWLYVLHGLAGKFIRNESVLGPTIVRGLRLEAVDAYLAYDRWLTILMPDFVYLIDINVFASGADPHAAGFADGGRVSDLELFKEMSPRSLDVACESPDPIELAVAAA